MWESILYFTYYILLLPFGVILSVSFAGIALLEKRNLKVLGGLILLCGCLQLLAYLIFDEELVWKIYPLIIHVPTVLLMCLRYGKNAVTALCSVSAAYLCCQPTKWIGILISSVTKSAVAGYAVQILFLIFVGGIVFFILAPTLSKLFHKDIKSALIFGSVPLVYYLYDYSMGIYTDFWINNNRVAIEFLPFLLCIAFFLFCVVYYEQYERKADTEQKENLVRVAVEQQSRELEAVKRSEQELRLLRHDMRMILGNLSVCIESGDTQTAREIISHYSDYVTGTKVEHYCKNTIVNCVLSAFAGKCKEEKVAFTYTVGVEELPVDDIVFSTILSNALDNALNAQRELPEEQRYVKLMLKLVKGKLLLSVKNPTRTVPTFIDGLPLSPKAGHGYGTKSIRYMTERLGGHCQFAVQEGVFSLRVVL